ncbi:MAG TPA: isocitrate lyase/PEP mutase family protein [Candidatus Acidoferrales bacterium]|nr:isocitrate lyase/PEP mutase family protein [Candidatus Acidoferrales bacterium]
MRKQTKEVQIRPTWKEVLDRHSPLLLPVAHDALTARLIQLAGYPAYQIGGFALVGAHFAYPDIDMTHYGENSMVIRNIISASNLPVLVDADDGYGDAKNVWRTVQGYEEMGASAIFIEDQVAPKRCGHMANKQVVSAETMVSKLQAAAAARRSPDTFILARTDARDPLGMDEALRRADLYIKAGADGVYVEALHSIEELERIGNVLKGFPLATSILEGGGKTPWIDPEELYRLGFSMILYPTSVIFRVTRTIQRALEDLIEHRPMPPRDSVTFHDYEEIMRMPFWAEIEDRYQHEPKTRLELPK